MDLSNFKAQINERTGARELTGPAKFLGWSVDQNTNEIREDFNSNGTKYRIARIETVNSHGEVFETTALVYEGNFSHPDANFVEGRDYLTTISEGVDEDDRRMYFRMSHLEIGVRITKDEFGFDSLFEQANESNESETEEVAETETAMDLNDSF